jgi:hypothetical protein
MFTDASRNLMIAAEGTTHLSAHSAYSVTGANEITGGSPAYARKVPTFGAASAGSKSLSANVVFDMPAGSSILFVGRWTALTGGTFLGMAAIGGVEMEFATDLASDTITAPAHGLVNTDRIVFVGGTPPGGLTEGTIYFVVGATTDTIQVAVTSGGAAINLTTQASAQCLVSKIVPETYGAQGTYQVNSGGTTLAVNV